MRKITLALIILTVWSVFQARAGSSMTYHDPSGFTFDYPAGWSIEQTDGQAGQIRVTPRHDPFFKVLLRFDQRPHAGQSAGVDAFMNQVCLPVISHDHGVEILEKWKSKIDGKDAATVLYTLPKTTVRAKMRYKAVVLLDEDKYCWFTYGGEDGSFEKYSTDAEKITASFKRL